MVVYIASRSPIPLIPWRQDAPAFNVIELSDQERKVCRHFTLPHIYQAGSHTSCGCGFNEGREHPECGDDATAESSEALESSSKLVHYIREYRVEQIYSCWSGDEGESKESERRIRPDDLIELDFYFREKELININHNDTA